jgi:5'-AMP-activated protein kinase catalytic alpha subunit
MIAGKKYTGITVDIWSCGVILYALVCGFLPFEDPNTANLYKKILNGEFSIPKFVSDDVRDLINKILNTDPEKRFKIVDIKTHAWFKKHSPETTLNEGIIVGYN